MLSVPPLRYPEQIFLRNSIFTSSRLFPFKWMGKSNRNFPLLFDLWIIKRDREKTFSERGRTNILFWWAATTEGEFVVTSKSLMGILMLSARRPLNWLYRDTQREKAQKRNWRGFHSMRNVKDEETVLYIVSVLQYWTYAVGQVSWINHRTTKTRRYSNIGQPWGRATVFWRPE